MRKLKVGQVVVVKEFIIPSNSESSGIRLGDMGIIKEIWCNPTNNKYGANVELRFFELDGVSEEMLGDGEFDIDNMTYQFYEDELRQAIGEEKQLNNVLEGN